MPFNNTIPTAIIYRYCDACWRLEEKKCYTQWEAKVAATGKRHCTFNFLDRLNVNRCCGRLRLTPKAMRRLMQARLNQQRAEVDSPTTIGSLGSLTLDDFERWTFAPQPPAHVRGSDDEIDF